MAINLNAPMRLCRHLAPGMVQKVRRCGWLRELDFVKGCFTQYPPASLLASLPLVPHRAMASSSTWGTLRPRTPARTTPSTPPASTACAAGPRCAEGLPLGDQPN